MTSTLDDIVAHAYRVFACYRLKGGLTVCRCPSCVGEQAERELRTVPLRNLSSRLLAEYTHSAHQWDDHTANQFRYFLPRYLELIAAGDAPTNISMENCLERLWEAKYRNAWPQPEADAIDAFFLALFRARLAAPVSINATGLPDLSGEPVEEVLCMVAHCGGDIARLLREWESDCRRNATLHIAAIVSIADWSRDRLQNSWWTGLTHNRLEIDEAMQTVIRWLSRQQTRERLEAVCLVEKDAGASVLLSHAEGIVAGMS